MADVRLTAVAFSWIIENQPFHWRLWTEVEKESHFNIRGAQVIQELCFMGGIEGANGFQLEYDRRLDGEVWLKFTD